MKTFWLVAAGFVVCVMAVWCSRTSYGQGPQVPENRKMIAVDNAIVDANQILYVYELQDEIHIGFRGLPSLGNGPTSVLIVKTTAANWRTLAAATGVEVPPRAAR